MLNLGPFSCHWQVIAHLIGLGLDEDMPLKQAVEEALKR
jgi:hypothetical protein